MPDRPTAARIRRAALEPSRTITTDNLTQMFEDRGRAERAKNGPSRDGRAVPSAWTANIRIVRSIGFRFALLHTLGFVISAAIVGFAAETLVTRALTEQARQRVESEFAELVSAFETDGSDALRKLVETHAAESETRLRYAIAGSDGQWISGERQLVRMASPPHDARSGHATEIVDPDSNATLVAKSRLADGSILVVADDLAHVEDVEDVVSGAFVTFLAVSAALGLASGAILSRVFLKRLDDVTRTAQAIIDGDLSRRIVRSGSGDDFDRLAETLNMMLERIGSLMENLHQVSNDIAHDLRTPLSRLRQTLEDMKASPLARRDDDAVDRALAEIDAMLATFSALLRIAQIEAGAQCSAFAKIDLTDIVATICEAYEPEAEATGRSITWDLHPGAYVHGDRDLLMQLFANLIENALCHTPIGTEIRINLQRYDDRDRQVVAEICDDGPGIPAADRDRVLRRFFRLERSRSTSGNGLGLSLVAAIAKLHDANLVLSDNAPGLSVAVKFKPWDPKAGTKRACDPSNSPVDLPRRLVTAYES